MPVVLFCHGIGDTLRHWVGVQAFFQERGVGSLVFSYSGYAKSTGRVRRKHYDEDFVVAYEELLRRVTEDAPVFVLGYSLGTGIAAHGVSHAAVKPAALFLCSGFTSFREAGLEIGSPLWLTRCVPDVWRTREAIRSLAIPVVVMHSDGDGLFSVQMGERLGKDFEMISVQGFSHSSPFFEVAVEYWEPIVKRMLELAA